MNIECKISISDKIMRVLGVARNEVEDVITKELAVYFFQQGMLSFGQAREWTGMSVWDFLALLREKKVPLHYDIAEYEEDMETIQEVM